MIVDPGIVDEDVKTAEACSNGAGGILDGRVIGNIDRKKADVESFGAERSGGFFSGRLVTCPQQDGDARSRYLAGYFKSEALAVN